MEVNALHPSFRDLYYLKEAFEDAAQERIKEHKLQHRLKSDKSFRLQYLVRAIQPSRHAGITTS
eukprot:2911895-Alexandrium_andersonii.AAC.1